MEDQKKEIKKFEITEEELQILAAFIGKQPLETALQPYAIIQNVVQRADKTKEVELKPNRQARRTKK